jgi:hypothetical protein
MATVMISAFRADGGDRATVPSIAYAIPRAAQKITSSASSQTSTVIGGSGETLMIVASGNAVQAKVGTGATPDATSSPHWLIPDGGSLPLYCVDGDTRVSIVDA